MFHSPGDATFYKPRRTATLLNVLLHRTDWSYYLIPYWYLLPKLNREKDRTQHRRFTRPTNKQGPKKEKPPEPRASELWSPEVPREPETCESEPRALRTYRSRSYYIWLLVVTAILFPASTGARCCNIRLILEFLLYEVTRSKFAQYRPSYYSQVFLWILVPF